MKFKGSWLPGAPKPSAENLAAFDRLKAELEQVKLPDWFLKLREQAGEPVRVDLVFDPADPKFSAFKQTEETERIKALGIVYLTEHELDRPGAADKGATIISALIAKTYFDFELHAFYARFLADANLKNQAMEEMRYAIYLNPQPTRDDLQFAAFIFMNAAGKDGWGFIESMLREAATRPEDAEAVIAYYGPIVQKGQIKTAIQPIKK